MAEEGVVERVGGACERCVEQLAASCFLTAALLVQTPRLVAAAATCYS